MLKNLNVCNNCRFPVYIQVEAHKMETETNEFIKELCRKNPAAQHRLLATYGPMVFRLVIRMVGQREDAEEIYQDVFVKALTKIDTFNPEKAEIATWLSRIAYHEAVNHLRRSHNDLVYMDGNELSATCGEIPDTPRDEQTVQLLEKAMALLPQADQTLLSLFYYENMSLRDIAYIIGSIPSTVGSRLSRIRHKLYQIIKQTKT